MDGMPAGTAATGVDLTRLGADLSAMLSGGSPGLRLALQSICAAATLAPVGYEALLRWDHPEFGAVPARDIFAAAALAGCETSLEAWIMVSAFRLRARWKPGGPYLAVNVSEAAIRNGLAGPMVRASLAMSGADPRGLSMEVPEAAVMRELDASRDFARFLRQQGVVMALDDFGSLMGPACVLRDIAFATVKIDPRLSLGVEGLTPESVRTRGVIAAVVDMAHALGATVVAEAVETAEQMAALREVGCDALQGWLMGRPGHGPID